MNAGGFWVRVRGVEIFAENEDALDKLIERYGTESKSGPTAMGGGTTLVSAESSKGGSIDKALLRRFIESGQGGMPSRQLAVTLGANRKAVQVGLKDWADRVGLWHGNFAAIFEKNLKDGMRGYRLTPEAVSAGKDILGIQ